MYCIGQTTRMFWLLDGEENDASFLRFDTIPECERRTDRRTDVPSLAIPGVCIAYSANALVKIVKIVHFYPPQSYKLPSLGMTSFKFRDEPYISRN